MPYLQYRDQRVTLTQADQAIGAFDGAVLRLPGDDAKGSSTQFISTANLAEKVAAATAGSPKKPTTATGGRLVSLVDGIQIAEKQILGRGDVIRIGGEEFRFYADKVKEPAASAPPPVPAAPVAPAPAAASTPAAASAAPPDAPKGDKVFVIPEAPVVEKKKGCAAVVAFVIALGAAGAGLLAVLLSVGG